MLIDTHCHLTSDRFAEDLDAVVARAQAAGIGAVVVIGTGLADADLGVAIQARWPSWCRRAVGLDPFTCFERHQQFADDLQALEAHLRAHACVAVGECGLEYYHQVLPRSAQIACLEAQLDLAVRLDLPVVIHCREAHADMAATLRAQPRARGVIHSFQGGPAEAAPYLELGWWLSFNGMVTVPRNAELRDAARSCPDDRLVLETDAPYLAPVPHRGRRCEPAMVADTAACIARERGVSIEVLAALTTRNAGALFPALGL